MFVKIRPYKPYKAGIVEADSQMRKKNKKDRSVHIRLPERAKYAIEEQARINNRTTQQEIEALVAIGLHVRKFNLKDYV